MRHAIDIHETLVSKLNQLSPQSLATKSSSVDVATQSRTTSPSGEPSGCETSSLRDLFPRARFFSGDDIHYDSVAESVETATEGQLVVYPIGECDPVQFMSEAMARGAAGILAEQILPCPLPQCIVGDVEMAMATIRAASSDHPDRKLLTIGVSGSHGKTTTALLIATLLRDQGIRTAFQTDLGECDGLVQTVSDDGPPIHAQLVRWLEETNDAQCQAVVIELSDEHARRGAYDAIQFDLLVVTGSPSRSQDFGPSGLHCLLDRLAPEAAVIASADDNQTLQVINDHGAQLVTYGVRCSADVTAKIIEESGGMSTLAVTHADVTAVMESRLCGGAMAGNHAAAAAIGILTQQPLHAVVESLGKLNRVPGRQERLESFNHPTVVVDVGGCPNRVSETLRTMRRMKGGGRLWCVLAIEANDTDEQLARYGSCIERFADQTIVTCRDEGKTRFLRDSHAILDGVDNLASLRLSADRQKAIGWAIACAKPTDTIVVVGGVTRRSPNAQRLEIEQLAGWVESERKNQTPPDSDDGADSSPHTFSIFQ